MERPPSIRVRFRNNQDEPVKGLGYLISIVSVILLGVAALNSAPRDPVLQLCLIGGMATSIVGMGLRYWSYRRDGA